MSSSDAASAPDRRPDVEVALDAATVAIVSALILLAADRLVAMSLVVPAVVVGRMVLWRRLLGPRGFGREIALFSVCAAVGAFNDWNTVVLHGVYRYEVAAWLPGDGALPAWMLLFWGSILRFMASLAAWPRLGPVTTTDRVGLPGRRIEHRGARLLVLLALVVGTRQAVFRWYDEPLLSWLPFAIAAAAWLLLLGVDRHDRRLALLAVTVGTAVEAAYITVGGLHRYEQPLVGGVPLWIILWWPIGVLVWKDLSLRIRMTLNRSGNSAPGPAATPA